MAKNTFIMKTQKRTGKKFFGILLLGAIATVIYINKDKFPFKLPFGQKDEADKKAKIDKLVKEYEEFRILYEKTTDEEEKYKIWLKLKVLEGKIEVARGW